MDRAVAQVPERPSSIPDAFVKKDGAPDVAFQGHEFFLFATDHQEFTPSGVIGNPLRSSAEKGNRTYERYAEHLAAALARVREARGRGPHARVARRSSEPTRHGPSRSQPDDEEERMKVAMHNWMRAEPVETTIRRLAKFGYDGIEISYDSVALGDNAPGTAAVRRVAQGERHRVRRLDLADVRGPRPDPRRSRGAGGLRRLPQGRDHDDQGAARRRRPSPARCASSPPRSAR